MTTIEPDVLWLHANASRPSGERIASPGYSRSRVSLARRRTDASSATTPQTIAARNTSPGVAGSGTTNWLRSGRAARRSDWATCHVCAVGRPNAVAGPRAVQRLARMTATVPTTARMGSGTRLRAKRAGTADPTAAEISSGPKARPARSPCKRRPTAVAAITEAASTQTSGSRRRSMRITRPRRPNRHGETAEGWELRWVS